MSNNADDYAFLKTMMSAPTDKKFKSVKWNYIQDTNQNYSNGIVNWDLSQLANIATEHIDWSTVFLAIPQIAVLSQSVGDGLVRCPLGVSLKQCSAGLISSAELKIGDKVMNTVCQNLHTYNTWRQVASSNKNSEIVNDMFNMGKLDTSDAWAYSLNYTRSARTILMDKYRAGNGLCDNVVLSDFDKVQTADQKANVPVETTLQGSVSNDGAYQRLKQVKDAQTTYVDNPRIMDLTALQNELEPYVYSVGPLGDNTQAASANNYTAYYYTSLIRLKDIMDIFGQISLQRGLYVKLKLTLNTGSCAIRYAQRPSAEGAEAFNGGRFTFLNETTFKDYCPLYFHSNKVVNSITTSANSRQYALSLYVGSLNGVGSISTVSPNQATLGIPSHPISSCRLYYKTVELTEDSALMLYEKVGQGRRIQYTDLYNQIVSNISASNNFNVQLTSGVSKARALLIVPHISATVHGTSTDATWIGALNGTAGDGALTRPFAVPLSPFYGNHPSPMMSITNIQININGSNLFPNPVNYTYENYLENFNALQLNGNGEDILATGRVSKNDWENGYRYYLFTFPETSQTTTITLTGKNNNGVTCDYHVYVMSNRTITLSSVGTVESQDF
jgi:hypothetical protein